MEAFKNINVNEYFKRYGLKYGIYRAMFTKWPLHIIRDYENQKLLYYYKAKKYLLKYKKYAGHNPQGIEYGSCEITSPIWIYWKQGLQEAPAIVQKCVESIYRYEGDKVILLSDLNIDKYIKLPSSYNERANSGEISTAAYSDLIRYSLLEHFGGTWIDSTVLLTGKLPTYITKMPFFAYRDVFGKIYNPALVANWLIHTEPHNEIIRQARNMSYAYWKREKYVVEYLFTYIFLGFAIENNDGWDSIPYANSDYCNLMLEKLGNKRNKLITEHIKALTSVHKLTYKLNSEVINCKNNIYNQIIQNEL